MEHSYFKDKISAYHDGELKHEEQRMIAEHLEQCTECRKLLEELEKFDRMVERHSGLAGDEYWEQSAQKIEAAIGQETSKTEVTKVTPSVWKGVRWKLATVAASIAVLAFIALHEGEIADDIKQDFMGITPMELASPESIPSDSQIGELAPKKTIVAQPPAITPADAGLRRGGEMKDKDEAIDYAAVHDELPEDVDLDEAFREVMAEERGKSGLDTVLERLRKDTGWMGIPSVPVLGYRKPASDTSLAEIEVGDSEADSIFASSPPVTERAPAIEADSYSFDAVQVVQNARLLPLPETTTVDSKSEIAVESGETHIVTEMEPRETELGAEITVKGEQDVSILKEATADRPPTLDDWRARRDSLQQVVSAPTREHRKTAGTVGRSWTAQADEEDTVEWPELDKDELKQVLDSVTNEVVQSDPQYQLLEAHYQVAESTTDVWERARSVRYLREYLEDENSRYKLQAAWYLQQLGEIE